MARAITYKRGAYVEGADGSYFGPGDEVVFHNAHLGDLPPYVYYVRSLSWLVSGAGELLTYSCWVTTESRDGEIDDVQPYLLRKWREYCCDDCSYLSKTEAASK